MIVIQKHTFNTMTNYYSKCLQIFNIINWKKTNQLLSKIQPFVTLQNSVVYKSSTNIYYDPISTRTVSQITNDTL